MPDCAQLPSLTIARAALLTCAWLPLHLLARLASLMLCSDSVAPARSVSQAACNVDLNLGHACEPGRPRLREFERPRLCLLAAHCQPVLGCPRLQSLGQPFARVCLVALAPTRSIGLALACSDSLARFRSASLVLASSDSLSPTRSVSQAACIMYLDLGHACVLGCPHLWMPGRHRLRALVTPRSQSQGQPRSRVLGCPCTRSLVQPRS